MLHFNILKYLVVKPSTKILLSETNDQSFLFDEKYFDFLKSINNKNNVFYVETTSFCICKDIECKIQFCNNDWIEKTFVNNTFVLVPKGKFLDKEGYFPTIRINGNCKHRLEPLSKLYLLV